MSLLEQRDAITQYCTRQSLQIADWFEERQTAAKSGRPVFGQMLKQLTQGKADGVVIHKIDRSARNLRDWANLGELMDRGIDVRFVSESLDMRSRGGRLSADIQAVVAADYVRNLREETRKGFYGRLKQGVYPLPAPCGYRDEGKGVPKSIDPVTGPLVRKAFELYATGRYSLHLLRHEMFRHGLRSPNGKPFCRNSLSILLRNPFYIGLIRIRRTGEMFEGAHEPLVSKFTFDRVQQILSGKNVAGPYRHDHSFRRLFACAKCRNILTGERQKGHVYYRCHTRGCGGASVREEVIASTLEQVFQPLQFTAQELQYLRRKLASLKTGRQAERERQLRTVELQLHQIRERLNRLTDAVIDGLIDKPEFEERKAVLLLEQRTIEENKAAIAATNGTVADTVSELFELAGSLYLSHKMGTVEENRNLIRLTTSNRTVSGKNVVVTLDSPFDLVAKRAIACDGAPLRARLRTWDRLLAKAVRYIDSQPYSRFRLPRHGTCGDLGNFERDELVA